jgi:transforming growth factor-beta-induced protein
LHLSLLTAGLLPIAIGACSSDANDATTTSTSIGAATTTVAGDATSSTQPPPIEAETQFDIVGTALTNTVFTQLAGLVVDADLVDTLREGPFTVFAPTDAAFGKLPLDVLRAVQKDPDTLSTVLLHHVVAGTITPDQLAEGELTTAAGTTLAVTKVGDTFYVDGNEIGDGVAATNGEVYVMNDVLVPALGDIVDVATTLPGFGTLTDLVTQADLVATLQGDGPFTVFAPIDAAFEALPKATLDAVLADPELLATVLTYHVVAGKLTTDQLVDGPLMTIAGVELTVTHDGDTVLIDGNPIAVQNVQATNGVIHAMGAVLVPEA